MRTTKARIGSAVVALAAFSALSDAAGAAVIIKSFRCTICVTDTKRPDDCKSIAADGKVVVSEEALQGLEGEIGQGATIMHAAAAAAPAAHERHRHRHSDQDP